MQGRLKRSRSLAIFIISLLLIATGSAEEIKLKMSGGVYTLPARLNNVITLDFIVDSGAADVSIPAEVALTLIRTGTVTQKDFLPGQTYRLADGSTVKSPRFTIRHLEVGKQTFEKVIASIGPTGSSLLLGQSFLRRIGKWTIDSKRQVFSIFDEASFRDNVSRLDPSLFPTSPPSQKKRLKNYSGSSGNLAWPTSYKYVSPDGFFSLPNNPVAVY